VTTLTSDPAVPRDGAPARPRDRAVAGYKDLVAMVQETGLMRRRRGFYAVRISTTLLALAGIVTGVALLGDSWWTLPLAAALALVMTQGAFLGHDGAHRQIWASHRANEWTGRVFACLVAGLSYGWWMGKHNKHHQAPNQKGIDTDIESDVVSFHTEAAESRRGLLAFLTRRQGWFFPPLLLLAGANLHVDSLRTLLGRKAPKRRFVDLGMMAAHWTLYLGFLLAVTSPAITAAFVGVHLATFGVSMGGAFAPNHMGMPIVPKGVKANFLNRQVAMSRNISGGFGIDLVMGGLNFQIEHHLFPSMPRPNLRKVQPIVAEFCAEHGITYTQTTFFGAYRHIIADLNRVGLAARNPFTCPLRAELGR
jgi:fatty acid desaturase